MRAPVYFIGHGSPMNALESNEFTMRLERMRSYYPNPRAILCVSAHWMTEGSWITRMPQPKTIHDFYGFPQALFEVQYPAPGSPEIADEVRAAIVDPRIHADDEMWGYDHGSWSVLRHIFPEAKTPLLQLSVYISQPAEYHYKLGTQLRALRDRGILIVASGNIVHNLRRIRWEPNPAPYPWALEFDEWSKEKILTRDHNALVNDYQASEAGRLSVPTPDHYYPLLYAIGASDESDAVQFEYEGIQNASISMRSIRFGA